ncbi:CRISP [Mytilus coruscus]|uniref:CRISP n=1 Tax=Mytilus coruscus TaxID=42192 RepID=A0A6J8AVM5_MYTCO|nr:CRISP [Mytilus coruscus]
MLRFFVLIFAVEIASCNLMDNEIYKQLVLDEHSKYRRMQAASNMNKLEWDDQLKNEAHNWTKACIWGHEGGGRGENKGFFVGDNYEEGISDMLKSWGNYLSEYPYLKGTPCSKCLANEGCDDGLCTASTVFTEPCEDELETEFCAKYQSYCKKSETFMVDNCRKTCNFCKMN